MSTSFTNSQTQTFTLTHAKYLASKVATDLKRIQRLYGCPSDTTINEYESELTELLKMGYVKEIMYGFQQDSKWIEPTLVYTLQDLTGFSSADDDPGRIKANANISDSHFTSYLIRTEKYHQLTQTERNHFHSTLPFQREGAPTPGVNGYLSADKTYSSGGTSLNRSSVKSF